MGVVMTLPWGRELTAGDLAAMPDDGHRYELIDGTLLVTPSPSREHQGIAAELIFRLRLACPRDLKVLAAPLDVVYSDTTLLQPDILVVAKATYYDAAPLRPLLAVEILSPSTRLVDLNLKKKQFERAGCPSYWVVDPIDLRLTAWDLHDGAYVEVADVLGEESWTAVRAFPVTIVPAILRD